MRDRDLDQIKEMLPITPGISGKERYFNSAVLIPLVLIDGEYQFLFQLRSNDIRQPGEVCFPGGGYDSKADDDFEETAIRETVEELGIQEEKIEIIGRLDTIISPSGTTIDSFVAIIDINSLEELEINRREVAEVFTLPVSYFKNHEPKKYETLVKVMPSYIDDNGKEVTLFPADKLDVSDIYSKPWGKHKYPIFVYEEIDSEYLVWGLTARLIYDLIRKLSHFSK